MITEDYISYETAKLLKEKGFTLPVKNYYSLYTEDVKYNLQKKYGAKKNWNAFAFAVSRPSQSLVMKWLREVHNIALNVCYLLGMWSYSVYRTDVSSSGFNSEDFDTYEEACEAAILYAIKNLI